MKEGQVEGQVLENLSLIEALFCMASFGLGTSRDKFLEVQKIIKRKHAYYYLYTRNKKNLSLLVPISKKSLFYIASFRDRFGGQLVPLFKIGGFS